MHPNWGKNLRRHFSDQTRCRMVECETPIAEINCFLSWMAANWRLSHNYDDVNLQDPSLSPPTKISFRNQRAFCTSSLRRQIGVTMFIWQIMSSTRFDWMKMSLGTWFSFLTAFWPKKCTKWKNIITTWISQFTSWNSSRANGTQTISVFWKFS